MAQLPAPRCKPLLLAAIWRRKPTASGLAQENSNLMRLTACFCYNTIEIDV